MKNIFRFIRLLFSGLVRCGEFLFVVFCLFTTTNPSHAQWVQTNGPHSGCVQCFAVAGANIFAGTQNLYGVYGVFRSTNNGISWAQTGLMNHNIWCLAVSPNGTGGTNLFAGTYGDGVFLSTNDGDSWNLVDNGLTDPDVRALVISGTNMFAWTFGDGVVLSTNNGANWTQTGLHEWVNALAISGTNIFAATDTSGIYRSTNNGGTWTQSKSNREWVVALTVSGSSVFAATYNGVCCTTDNGVSWTESSSGLPQGGAYVEALAVSGTNIYAGTYAGVYVSTDNGTNWTETGLKNVDVRALAVSGPCLFAGTIYSGVYLSFDEGASWSWNGFPISTVSALAVSGITLFAGTEEGVFLSTTSGTSWVQTSGPLYWEDDYRFEYVSAMAVSGANLFAAGYSQTGIILGYVFGNYLSTNNGTNWSRVGQPPPLSGRLPQPHPQFLVVSGTNLFTGGLGGYISRRMRGPAGRL